MASELGQDSPVGEAGRMWTLAAPHTHWDRHTAVDLQDSGPRDQKGRRQAQRGKHCSPAGRTMWGSNRTPGAHREPAEGQTAADTLDEPESRVGLCKADWESAHTAVGCHKLPWSQTCEHAGYNMRDIPPVWRAKLSSIIRSNIDRAFTNVSFIDTRSAVKRG